MRHRGTGFVQAGLPQHLRDWGLYLYDTAEMCKLCDHGTLNVLLTDAVSGYGMNSWAMANGIMSGPREA